MGAWRAGRIFSTVFNTGLRTIKLLVSAIGRLLLVWLVVVPFQSAWAADPFVDWKTIESEHFLVHYPVQHKIPAERVAVIAEQVHNILSVEFNWVPSEKTELVLSDESDLANGLATPLNINRSILFMALPSSVGGVEDFDDWMTTLIIHEYTHILHLDKAGGLPRGLRKVFGRFLLLFPNLFEPAWMIEGLATHKETDLNRGIGRGQSSTYAMMMRAESMQGLKPVSQVNLPINSWPAGATRYLYGVYFMRFISEQYGEEKIVELVDAHSNNIVPFAINSSFYRVFSKDVKQMWTEFENWLEHRYSAQIQRVTEQGVDASIAITTNGYFNGPVRASGNSLYFVRNTGNHQPELVRIKDINQPNSIEVLTEVQQAANIRPHPDAGVLISQLEVCDEYYLYKDLYVFDEQTDELKRITECGRYVRAVWSPAGNSIIALHHEAGRYELHRLTAEGDQEETLWVSEGDEIVAQIDISPDGNILAASVWRKGAGWNLELFEIQGRRWSKVTTDTAIQSNPVYINAGRDIVYSADYDGIYNLYRYELSSGQHYKISNVIGGAFQATQLAGSPSIYYAGYSAKGVDIYRLDATDTSVAVLPAENQWLSAYDYSQRNFEQRDYSPWPGLKPAWWFPVLALNEDSNEIGFTTAGNDGLGIHNYSLTLAYETDNNIPLGSLFYAYSNRLVLGASRTNNIFRDNNGDFDRARPTDSLQAVFIVPRTRLLSSHNFLLAAVWEKDSDDTLAPTAVPAEDFEDNILGLAWLYKSSRQYPLSISENDGASLRMVIEDSDSFNSDFTGQVYTLDWKQFIRTGNESVLALRFLQGWGTDQPSSFRLGGENTGVQLTLTGQTGAAVFAQREYALRGYDEGLPQLRGRRAQLLSAEWRFPIQRVERGFMTPPLGLMQWSGAFFVDSGAAYDQDSADRYFTGAGLEINADLNLFYMVPVRARLGYAHGFDNNIGDDRLYLSVGASF